MKKIRIVVDELSSLSCQMLEEIQIIILYKQQISVTALFDLILKREIIGSFFLQIPTIRVS